LVALEGEEIDKQRHEPKQARANQDTVLKEEHLCLHVQEMDADTGIGLAGEPVVRRVHPFESDGEDGYRYREEASRPAEPPGDGWAFWHVWQAAEPEAIPPDRYEDAQRRRQPPEQDQAGTVRRSDIEDGGWCVGWTHGCVSPFQQGTILADSIAARGRGVNGGQECHLSG
jgi:hypothetical protein